MNASSRALREIVRRLRGPACRCGLVAATVCLALAAAGCSGQQVAQLQRDVLDLREQIDEVKRSQAAQRVRYDEFRNRLVLIQDEIESRKVADSRRQGRWIDDVPRLPTVTIGVDGTIRRDDRSAQARAEPAAIRGDAAPGGGFGGPGAAVRRRAVSEDSVARALAPAPRPAGPTRAVGDHPPQQLTEPAADPATAYRQAKELLDSGRLREARQRFEAFGRDHPRHALADNALYWLGETWYAQSLWLDAATAFGKVVSEHPGGNKVPDAMLKTGLCYHNLGERRSAVEVFEQLAAMYPGTPAARLAQQRLDALRSTP